MNTIQLQDAISLKQAVSVINEMLSQIYSRPFSMKYVTLYKYAKKGLLEYTSLDVGTSKVMLTTMESINKFVDFVVHNNMSKMKKERTIRLNTKQLSK